MFSGCLFDVALWILLIWCYYCLRCVVGLVVSFVAVCLFGFGLVNGLCGVAVGGFGGYRFDYLFGFGLGIAVCCYFVTCWFCLCCVGFNCCIGYGISLLGWCDLLRFPWFGCWLLLMLIVSGSCGTGWCFVF